MQKWHHDPLFTPFYHETGFIMTAASDSGYQSCLDYQESENAPLTPLNTASDFQKTMPDGVLTGSFPNWRGFWKKSGAGWVFASGAMRAMHAEATRLGVRFITGDPEGNVTSLLYDSDRTAVLGATTADSTSHFAAQTILAAGASSTRLLDFESQLRPTAWTLAHLPLSASEAQLYRNLPVLYGVDRGFFIEPDEEKHEMKICDEHPGYVNPVANSTTGAMESVPFSRMQIPVEAEMRMRRLLHESMPQFADRPFSFARICWDADTIDRMFLIDKHPNIANLLVAVGGSGNGFMTSPAIGSIVADVLEGKEGDERVRQVMRWRPKLCKDRDLWDTQGRHGAEEKVMDFRDVAEWTKIGE
jgi:sarcosine oxidase/L-pipecolate oxidase